MRTTLLFAATAARRSEVQGQVIGPRALRTAAMAELPRMD
jgi:hypothetical protein